MATPWRAYTVVQILDKANNDSGWAGLVRTIIDFSQSVNANALNYLQNVLGLMADMTNLGAAAPGNWLAAKIANADARIALRAWLTLSQQHEELYNKCMEAYQEGITEVYARFPALETFGIKVVSKPLPLKVLPR